MLEQISNVCVRNTNDWLRLLDVRVDIDDINVVFHSASVVLPSLFYILPLAPLSLSLSLLSSPPRLVLIAIRCILLLTPITSNSFAFLWCLLHLQETPKIRTKSWNLIFAKRTIQRFAISLLLSCPLLFFPRLSYTLLTSTFLSCPVMCVV